MTENQALDTTQDDDADDITALETENESLRAEVEYLQKQVATEKRNRERLARVIGDLGVVLGSVGEEPEALVDRAKTAMLTSGRRRLPETRQSKTKRFEIQWYDEAAGALKSCKVYAIVSFYEDGTVGEIFLNIGDEHGTTLSGMADAFSIACSIALQHGCPLLVLVNKFRYTKFPPAGTLVVPEGAERKVVTSIIDAVFAWVETVVPPEK